jgi:CheY-like chemotaxis protein
LIRQHVKEVSARPNPHGSQALVDTPLTIAPRLGLLVVAANVRLRAMLYLALRTRGIAVWVAADGREAVELYQRQRDVISVVLIDEALPKQGAVQILQALRTADPRVCCCILGEGRGCSEADLAGLEVARFFPSPLCLEDLVEGLCQLTASPAEPMLAPETALPSTDAEELIEVERRAEPRYSCRLEALCRPVGQSAPWAWNSSRLEEISFSGLRMHLARRFELGTLLILELPGSGADSAHRFLARAIRAGAAAEGGWTLDCVFTGRLSEAELHALKGSQQ